MKSRSPGTKAALDGLYEIGKLPLSNTRSTYQMPHLATKFIIFVVAIHELYIA